MWMLGRNPAPQEARERHSTSSHSQDALSLKVPLPTEPSLRAYHGHPHICKPAASLLKAQLSGGGITQRAWEYFVVDSVEFQPLVEQLFSVEGLLFLE